MPKPIPRSEELLQLMQARAATVNDNDEGRALASPARATGSSNKPVAISRDVCKEIYERGQRHRALQEERVEVGAQLRLVDEMRECTFSPQTNHADPTTEHASCQGAGARPKQSIYDRGLQAKERRRMATEEKAKQREEEELRECTFHPGVLSQLRPADACAGSSLAAQQMIAASSFDHGLNPVPSTAASEEVPQSENLRNVVLSMLSEWQATERTQSTGNVLPPSELPALSETESQDEVSAKVGAMLEVWRASREDHSQQPHSAGLARMQAPVIATRNCARDRALTAP